VRVNFKMDVLLMISKAYWIVHPAFIRLCEISQAASVMLLVSYAAGLL
jgi:hypothetical protein